MNIASTIVADVITFLSGVSSLQGQTIVAAYDSDINPVPLNNGIISVGIDSIEIGGKKTATAKDGAIIQTTDRDAEIKLKISFFVPYNSGCVVASELFDKVYTAMLFSYSKSECINAHCGDVNYSRDTESLVCESVLTLKQTIKN